MHRSCPNSLAAWRFWSAYQSLDGQKATRHPTAAMRWPSRDRNRMRGTARLAAPSAAACTCVRNSSPLRPRGLHRVEESRPFLAEILGVLFDGHVAGDRLQSAPRGHAIVVRLDLERHE